jgi:hypothetical protein
VTPLLQAAAVIPLMFALGQATSQVPPPAERLVQALAPFPAELPAALSNGVEPPLERRRLEVYDQLWSMGTAAVPALCRGLGDADVRVRRNVALFLNVAAGNWYDRGRARLPIAPCANALARALEDADGRVRGLAAQAVPATGTAGAVAVPALVAMLGSPSEGDRNSACLGLAGLGPVARAALPVLEKLQSDPSPDVRGFARRAIQRIEPSRP